MNQKKFSSALSPHRVTSPPQCQGVVRALSVFLLVKQVNRMTRAFDKPAPAGPPTTKECGYCATTIPIKAARCPNCTSQLSA